MLKLQKELFMTAYFEHECSALRPVPLYLNILLFFISWKHKNKVYNCLYIFGF